MGEIKIKLYAHENDNYVELYKVIEGKTNQKYIARVTYGSGDDGEWYFVADPLGYCELDYACPKDYVFIICDSNDKELFCDSNGEIKNPFPTLERKATLSWNEIMHDHPCKKEGLNSWLLSYLTSEISKTILKDEPCHEANWPYWRDETKKEVISRFTHLGENYCIYALSRKHRYCDCEWIDYFSGYEVMDEYTSYIKWHGAFFDESKTGPNYSGNVAIEIVINTLKKIYKRERSLSYVNRTDWGNYEKRLDYHQAATLLLKGNYNRAYVHETANKEKNNRTFYDDSKKMRQDFPNIKMHYSF